MICESIIAMLRDSLLKRLDRALTDRYSARESKLFEERKRIKGRKAKDIESAKPKA